MSAPQRFSCAVITGASAGLGRALARGLAARCDRLVLVARRGAVLEELAAGIRAEAGATPESGATRAAGATPEVVPLVLDLSAPGPGAALTAELTTAGVDPAQVDLLILNAATTEFGAFLDTPLDRLQRAQNLNLAAPLELMHSVGSWMRASGRGTIVSVASVAAFGTGPLMSAYYAEKNWLRVLSLSLDAELRPHGVAVVTVCPGPFASEFHTRAGIPGLSKAVLPSAERVAGRIIRAIERRQRLVPIGAAARLWSLLAPRLPWRLTRWIMHQAQAARMRRA